MTTGRSRLARWRSLSALLVSALLLALYARGGLAWPLGFVMLVPWLLALDRARGPWGAVGRGVLMALACVGLVFPWFGAAVGAFTGLGTFAGTAALVALAPLLQPQFVAYALVRQLAGRRHGAALRAVAAASAWVACEWTLPKLLGDTLGHGLAPSTTLRQAADLGGAAGLTWMLLLCNEAVAVAIARRKRGWRLALRPLAAAMLLVAVPAGYGAWRLSTLPTPPDGSRASIRIAMVQASQTDYERRRREHGAYAVVREALDAHYALSWSAIRDHGADVLLWSETVYPTTFGSPRSADGAALDREIQDFVDTVGVPLVFGSYDRDAAGEYNAAMFLEPGRGRLGTYRKTHPFPLTEHVPRWLDGPLLRRTLPWTGGWLPGDGARVLPLRTADGRELNVVPLICLDDVHAALAIDGARLGAQAIVGMSNDAWFTTHPQGARLHLQVATFRSIETRLPQARVTTNGLSAIIDDTGAVSAATAMGDQAVLTAELPLRDPAPTLMVRWGDWVGRAGLALVCALLVLLPAWRALRARRVRRAEGAPAMLEVSLLSPAMRALAAALRAGAALGLAWLAVDMWRRVGLQVRTVSQLWQFAACVVAPLLAAAAVLRVGAARARIEGEALVLDHPRRRVEIPLASIASLPAWRLPLPRAGVAVALASGRRWTHGLAVARPLALRRMVQAAGAALRAPSRADDRRLRFADARGQARHAWLDHALVKFALFPLLPALVAFRLHQVIAFGGTFGEWRTYGAGAWLAGLLIWWGAWSLGMMLFAAALRLVVEPAAWLAQARRPAATDAARDGLEWPARAAYYLGVPAWLAWRLLAGG